MVRSDLEVQAGAFAKRLRDLLNKTVCNNAQLGVALASEPIGSAFVGTAVTAGKPYGRPIGLGATTRSPYCWIKIGFTVWMNEHGYLTVWKSFVGLSVDPDGKEVVFHYDYERDKDKNPEDDGCYTEAHLQIDGESAALNKLIAASPRSSKGMHKLHFPVGGRRFRPSLEDVIEFLIRERLIDKRPGWDKVLNVSRQEFQDRQLCAAICARPEVAAAELKRIGYL